MFGFIRRLFESAQEHPTAPGVLTHGIASNPRFDPQLVPQLKQDHRELIHLFQQLGRLPELDQWPLLPAQLLAFKAQLEAHLLAENVRFYNYVEYTLRDDYEDSRLIRDFRREMNSIARGVIDFVKKYQHNIVDPLERAAFLSDYRTVGNLLVQRIEREEGSLYPLYQPI